MVPNKKITEADLLDIVRPGGVLLSCLKVFREESEPEEIRGLEILSNQKKRGRKKRVVCRVLPRLQGSLRAVEEAVEEAKELASSVLILYIFNYISSEGLRLLRENEVSGVDLSGNGVVVVPGEWFILQAGHENRFPQSRPLGNPYAGRSAQVGRLLLEQREWGSLKAMVEGIEERGGTISVAQVSKAVQAMEDDLVVAKKEGGILLRNPAKLLDELGASYKPFNFSQEVALRLRDEQGWAGRFSGFDWMVTGESSVTRHTAFAQGGAVRIAVANLELALEQLGGEPESVPSFADVELIVVKGPEYYFQVEMDEAGGRWASPVQTWLELQAGDARQQDAAAEIRKKFWGESGL